VLAPTWNEFHPYLSTTRFAVRPPCQVPAQPPAVLARFCLTYPQAACCSACHLGANFIDKLVQLIFNSVACHDAGRQWKIVALDSAGGWYLCNSVVAVKHEQRPRRWPWFLLLPNEISLELARGIQCSHRGSRMVG